MLEDPDGQSSSPGLTLLLVLQLNGCDPVKGPREERLAGMSRGPRTTRSGNPRLSCPATLCVCVCVCVCVCACVWYVCVVCAFLPPTPRNPHSKVVLPHKPSVRGEPRLPSFGALLGRRKPRTDLSTKTRTNSTHFHNRVPLTQPSATVLKVPAVPVVVHLTQFLNSPPRPPTGYSHQHLWPYFSEPGPASNTNPRKAVPQILMPRMTPVHPSLGHGHGSM